MVELNHRERTVKVKIVYYGPPVGGKTTNLQVLHQHAAAQRRGEFVSVNSAQDRTVLFDLLPMKAPGFRGFDLRLQILAVPGQAMYGATRRLTLKGADSVVFVANSAADRWDENVQSFREMTENLIAHQLDPASLPMVLQYNKRDLPEVTAFEFMDRTLNARKVESIAAVAVRGEGVLETFAAILARTMQDLARRYHIVDVARGQTLKEWIHSTMLSIFGTTSLYAIGGAAAEAAAPVDVAVVQNRSAPVPERRTVRVELPEDAIKKAWQSPDARSNETLVETYAQTSSRLGIELELVREQRDVARQRLGELQQSLQASREVLAGRPVDTALRALLAPLAASAGTTHATFLIPAVDGTLRPAVLWGLTEDPALRTTAGVRYVVESVAHGTVPRAHHAADLLDLGEALTVRDPMFASVVSVPVRTPRGLRGLAMLYFSPDDALPPSDTLDHLGMVGGSLAASLEVAGALDTARVAERTLHMALLGTAALHGMEDALTSMLLVRDRLGNLRRRPDAPAWFNNEFMKLTPCLSDALATGRSLLGFSRGQIEKDVMEVDELVHDVRSSGVEVQVGPGVASIVGDRILLRLAMVALVDHARGTNPSGAPRLMVVSEGGRVKLRVEMGSAASPDASAEARLAGPDLRLAFAQKIAQLHGGSLGSEMDQHQVLWTTISLQPA